MIQPLRNLVYVDPIGDPDITQGGIIIPESARKRSKQGIVKYIGPDVKDIKVMDYVIYSEYSGTIMDISDEGRLIVFEEKAIEVILEHISGFEIPGLYFKSLDNKFYPCNYEMVFDFMTEAIRNNTEINTNYRYKNRREEKGRFDSNRTITSKK